MQNTFTPSQDTHSLINYGIGLEVQSLVLCISSNGKGGSLPVAPLDLETSEPSCLPDAQLTLVKHK